MALKRAGWLQMFRIVIFCHFACNGSVNDALPDACPSVNNALL